jgi:hypothetical protein
MWHYNQYLVKAWPRRSFHDCLSWAQCVQSLTPRARLSLFTPSTHLDFGLPWFLLSMGLALNRAFCGRSSDHVTSVAQSACLHDNKDIRAVKLSIEFVVVPSPVDTIFDSKLNSVAIRIHPNIYTRIKIYKLRLNGCHEVKVMWFFKWIHSCYLIVKI